MTEDDYADIPAIEITQWQAGRVLSEADIALIARLLKQHDDEIGHEVDVFATAREQVLRQLGGQELVDLDAQSSELTGRLAFERACITVAQKQADLAKLKS